jgi:hypothetical protein
MFFLLNCYINQQNIKVKLKLHKGAITEPIQKTKKIKDQNESIIKPNKTLADSGVCLGCKQTAKVK